ncbi:hypothetical protein EC973_005172 [Apophysomyces ossiformis]|uniref:Uncharacterized protein n=1 Tax=Apophysomyces ossiformis TaxID=679940 RepID=A0A8H7EUK0_9FUNG|nr:hypothetical protein EC973_005172 [Apophysomyces ossiformis]
MLGTISVYNAKQLRSHPARSSRPLEGPCTAEDVNTPMTIDPIVSESRKSDCVRIDDIDQYLAECEASENEEEEDVGTLWTTGDSTLVESRIDGSALPMERRAGERKLRIPEFVLRNAVDSRATQCQALIPYKPLILEQKVNYDAKKTNGQGMDLDRQSDICDVMAMELD